MSSQCEQSFGEGSAESARGRVWDDHDADGYAAEKVAGYLSRAARHEDVAFHISTALHCLQLELTRRRPVSLSSTERDRILTGLELARRPTLSLFGRSTERDLAAKALDAAATLVREWACVAGGSNSRRTGAQADQHDYVRWLRNACHNICLIDDIERRDKERREALFALILRAAP